STCRALDGLMAIRRGGIVDEPKPLLDVRRDGVVLIARLIEPLEHGARVLGVVDRAHVDIEPKHEPGKRFRRPGHHATVACHTPRPGSSRSTGAAGSPAAAARCGPGAAAGDCCTANTRIVGASIVLAGLIATATIITGAGDRLAGDAFLGSRGAGPARLDD